MKRSSAKERVVVRLVLALESSSRTYAVAVGDGDQPRAQRTSLRDGRTFVDVGELAAQALAGEATFDDVDTIAVDVGPGDVLSVRAAVAYANGLAFGLGVKIFPITSLELMAIAAQRTHPGPLLCLKRAMGGNTYAGLFVNGEVTEMRHGPLSSIVPAIAAGLETVDVAGTFEGEMADLLPDVIVTDTGIANADVAVLYQAARRAIIADPGRLVPVASPVNEGSWIFHNPAVCRHPYQ
jgi:tRNA A37 threonylcarbamoyladenosine modification protein TsaB